MKTTRGLLGASIAAALTFVGISARADGPGFALDRFDPSERGSDWFANESLDLRGHLRPAIGVVMDYGYRPLVLYNPDGNIGASVVRDQLFFHIGGNVVLWDRLRLGVNIPIAAYQFGHSAVSNGVLYKAPDGADIGDIRVGADVRLLGTYGDVFTLAAGVQAYAPTGTRANYTGDGTFRLQPRLMAAGEIGPFVYAAKAAFDYRPFDESVGGTQLGSEFLFGASAGVKVVGGQGIGVVLGPEIYGSTVVTSDAGAFQKTNTPYEALLGGHLTFAKDWRVGAAVGPGLTRGFGSPIYRILGSLEWAPAFDAGPPPDRDHDGIPDSEDACIDKPGVRTNDPATNGCPPPPADRDSDGILDKDDACPDVAGIKTDDPKTNGCPSDRDHDGIYDTVDACPDVPGVKTDDPLTNGCPPDRDKDGIVDSEDACPDVPGVKTDDPKTNGCPSDRDKDGIYDKDDACPDEPGPKNEDPKKNGCPAAFVKEGQIQILEQVKFRFGKADLDPAGDSILEAVLKVMQDHPEITTIRVEGHTDNKGAAALNKKLSADRAAAVASWLTKHGIDKKRLTSQGFGPSRPLDSNDTEQGRTNNRRVEFHIVPPATSTPAAATPAPKKP